MLDFCRCYALLAEWEVFSTELFNAIIDRLFSIHIDCVKELSCAAPSISDNENIPCHEDKLLPLI